MPPVVFPAVWIIIKKRKIMDNPSSNDMQLISNPLLAIVLASSSNSGGGGRIRRLFAFYLPILFLIVVCLESWFKFIKKWFSSFS